MRYWSKGLARRSALNIGWSEEERHVSVEDGLALLASVMPLQRVRGQLPPVGAHVIVSGDTQPPIVWRYISILTEGDFENIVKLATGPGMVRFLTASPEGRRLFLTLGRFLAVFTVTYLSTWLRVKIRPEARSGEPEAQPAVADDSPPELPGSGN